MKYELSININLHGSHGH